MTIHALVKNGGGETQDFRKECQVSNFNPSAVIENVQKWENIATRITDNKIQIN